MDAASLRSLIAATPDAQSAFTAGDYAACAAALNAQTTTLTIPAQLTVAGVLGGLSPAALAALWNNPNASTIRNDLRFQDRDAMGTWAALALAGGAVTQAEHDGVLAALAATTTAQASAAEVSGGRGTVISVASIAALVPAVLVANVTVTAPASLAVGASAEASVFAMDAQGNEITGRAVTWQTDHGDVLAVEDGGQLAALAEGAANVIAIVDGVVGRATVSVVA